MAMHGASEVVAVDVSESGLAEAKLRAAAFPQIKFQNASALALPFPDASFDFVWSAGVIHHTADFDKALSELTHVLRPGGKLFLLVTELAAYAGRLLRQSVQLLLTSVRITSILPFAPLVCRQIIENILWMICSFLFRY
jgi:ubiquinone/menaquinone biosynthesis C-methylase UbiE